jgi:hypothetical protein
MTTPVCTGSGHGAIVEFSDPKQTCRKVKGRDFITGKMVDTEVPTNGYCVRCTQWVPVTNRGLLIDHDRTQS